MPSSDLPATLAVVPAGTARPDRGGDARPILVIDSGLGGLTVVKELRRALPAERLVYFGDTARLPYGSKTPETVTGFVRQIVRHCRPFDPKHVVLACNTASALALNRLRREMPDLPVTGVIDPGARAAVRAAGSRPRPTIGVIGTEATVRSKAYDHAVHRRRQHARLMVRATPLLAAMVEEGRRADDPLVALALQQYLAPMLEKRLHVLLLGCTHYPMIASAVRRVAGPRVAVIDSAACCADDVARRLAAGGRLASNGAEGALQCLVTDNTPRFAKLASMFLETPVAAPALVEVDELYDAERVVPLRATA